jgi:hypothetical protein
VDDSDHGCITLLAFLPVAMCEQARLVVHSKNSVFWAGQTEPSGPVHRRDGHGMAVPKQRMRLEWEYSFFHGFGRRL